MWRAVTALHPSVRVDAQNNNLSETNRGWIHRRERIRNPRQATNHGWIRPSEMSLDRNHLSATKRDQSGRNELSEKDLTNR